MTPAVFRLPLAAVFFASTMFSAPSDSLVREPRGPDRPGQAAFVKTPDAPLIFTGQLLVWNDDRTFNPDAATQTRNAVRHLQQLFRAAGSSLDGLHQKLIANQAERDAMEKEVSRIDQLVAQDMVRLDTGNRTLMDAIKITARNLFYRTLAPFKAAYNNYRDDYSDSRELRQSAGVLRWTGTEIEVHLVPTVNFPSLHRDSNLLVIPPLLRSDTEVRRIFSVCSSLAPTIAVTIVSTRNPARLAAATARGKSASTRSGCTWPPGRTVNSIPSKPASAVSAAASS